MENSCDWPGSDALMRAYHDTEWGVPLHEDQKLRKTAQQHIFSS